MDEQELIENPEIESLEDYTDDIKELRRRIITCVIAFVAFFIILYANSNELLNRVVAIGNRMHYTFVYLSPQEVLIQQLRLSVIIALVFSLPIITTEIILFVLPAYEGETNIFVWIITPIIITILFLLGCFFSYKVLIPFVFNTLKEIGDQSGIIASISIAEYISMFLTLIVSLGVAFELPLLVLGLTGIGLLNADILKKSRKFVLIAILILAAFITPPDILSQVIVAGPLLLLYEISIALSRGVEKIQKKGESSYATGD